MRTFDKSSKLDNVCYDVRGPVLDEANRMQESGIDVLKLNIGNPAPFGFSAPEEVILDMIYTLRLCRDTDSHGYLLPVPRSRAVLPDQEYKGCCAGGYLYRQWRQ